MRFFPPLTWQSRPQVEAVLGMVPPGRVVVDLGAGGRRISPETICVDFAPFRDIDLVADVQRLPFRDSSVDLVFATGLLEHVADDRAVTSETWRVLRSGGLFHAELPFLQQYHQDPIDCRRYTVEGLTRELQRAGFEPVCSGAHIGPTVTMITLATHYAALLFEGRSRAARAVSTGVFFLSSVLLYPFKFLDALLMRKKNVHRLAFGVYCTGRKPAAARGHHPPAPASPATSW